MNPVRMWDSHEYPYFEELKKFLVANTSSEVFEYTFDIQELEEGLVIHGKPQLTGGSVDSCGDHRIAMAAATAACGCTGEIFLSGSQAVSKSYPRFWEDFGSLTGGSL